MTQEARLEALEALLGALVVHVCEPAKIDAIREKLEAELDRESAAVARQFLAKASASAQPLYDEMQRRIAASDESLRLKRLAAI